MAYRENYTPPKPTSRWKAALGVAVAVGLGLFLMWQMVEAL